MTAKLNRILVPTDFSDTATHALRYASELARRCGARITLLYADPFVPLIDYTATVGGWDEASFELAKVCAEQQLRIDARESIGDSVVWDVVVRVATPLAGILEQAQESAAELIVMGTHGRTGFRRLIIGSVTEAVMRSAEVPVIAVPPRSASTPSIKTVVCPIVYNAQCRDALAFAGQIAAPDARFIVFSTDSSATAAEETDELFALRAGLPKTIADRCDVRMLGDEHAYNRIEGLARSQHADLIVAAEPADRTTADVVRGTFAARLLQHSECPVLTVNASAAKHASRVARQEARTEMVGANR